MSKKRNRDASYYKCEAESSFHLCHLTFAPNRARLRLLINVRRFPRVGLGRAVGWH